jgi:hypothetical protein
MPSYNIDAYSAGSADMAMLPETVQLGQLQAMRQGVERGDFDLRRMEREEQAVFKEADEYGQYQELMSEASGKSPVERAEMVKSAFQRNASWGANEKITKSLSAVQSAERNVLQSRMDESQSFKLDVESENRDAVRETARIGAQNGLKAARQAEANFKNLADSNQLQDLGQFGTYLGSVGNVIPMETKKRLIEVGNSISADPSSSALFRGLGSVVSGFSKSESLLSTYASELSEFKPLLSAVEKDGFNLDFTLPEDEFKRRYEDAAAFYGNPENSSSPEGKAIASQFAKAGAMANKANALYSQVSRFKGGMDEDLQKLDAKDPDAVKVFVNQWNMMAGQLSGAVDREIGRKENSYAQQEREMKMRKTVLELQALASKPAAEAEKSRIAREKLELSKSLRDMGEEKARFEVLKFLREEPKNGSKSTDELIEERDRLYDDLMGSNPLGSGSGVNLIKR